jgi:serralysin
MKKTYLLSIVISVVIGSLIFGLETRASEVVGTVSTGVNSGSVGGTVITAPSASVPSGTYTTIQFVALSAAGSSGIRYTTDGITPDCSAGIPYQQIPLPISQTLTVKAIACYPNNQSSPVSTFSYTGSLSVVPSDMPSLLSSGIFVSTGTTLSASRLTATQQVRINVVDGGGTSTVVLPVNTIITAVDGSNFDANTLSAGTVSGTSLAGLGSGVVVDGALHWGIANRGLTFDHPVSISIFVGTVLNGQTLNVQRSISGSGDWTADGITLPATCVVTNGLCSFTATKASYYVATSASPTPTPTPTPTPSSSGGGGGGGGGSSQATVSASSLSAAAQKVDANKDGKIDVLDFNTLMINWGKTTVGNVADFNSDGKVDIFDFNSMMINWTK